MEFDSEVLSVASNNFSIGMSSPSTSAEEAGVDADLIGSCGNRSSTSDASPSVMIFEAFFDLLTPVLEFEGDLVRLGVDMMISDGIKSQCVRD